MPADLPAGRRPEHHPPVPLPVGPGDQRRGPAARLPGLHGRKTPPRPVGLLREPPDGGGRLRNPPGEPLRCLHAGDHVRGAARGMGMAASLLLGDCHLRRGRVPSKIRSRHRLRRRPHFGRGRRSRGRRGAEAGAQPHPGGLSEGKPVGPPVDEHHPDAVGFRLLRLLRLGGDLHGGAHGSARPARLLDQLHGPIVRDALGDAHRRIHQRPRRPDVRDDDQRRPSDADGSHLPGPDLQGERGRGVRIPADPGPAAELLRGSPLRVARRELFPGGANDQRQHRIRHQPRDRGRVFSGDRHRAVHELRIDRRVDGVRHLRFPLGDGNLHQLLLRRERQGSGHRREEQQQRRIRGDAGKRGCDRHRRRRGGDDEGHPGARLELRSGRVVGGLRARSIDPSTTTRRASRAFTGGFERKKNPARTREREKSRSGRPPGALDGALFGARPPTRHALSRKARAMTAESRTPFAKNRTGVNVIINKRE
mmetsp:Transcript_18310/g.42167  ORF Transcript_18310/g.42167 Transcript_18310/m.42167 type:complete len:480 (-) Transcript_18310:11-1450(-)